MAANDIESAAAHWLVRLERDTSQQTQADFEAWLTSDPRHQAAFVRMKEIWSRTDILKRLRPLDGVINERVIDEFGDRTPDADTPQAGSNRRRPLLALAASLLIVAAGGAVWLAAGHWGWERYQTGFGAFQRVVLADGSTAMLNTESRIRVRMTSRRREVVLEKGEVLFTVAHEAQRPFEVSAGDTVVRAVGTAFSMRLRAPKQVDVLVAKGRVAINPSADSPVGPPEPTAQSPTLAAGEAASIQARRPLHVQRMAAEDVTRRLAWTQGRIWFDRATLAEAVAELNRYNRKQLVIDDPSIQGLRIGGAFDTADLDSFVAALETFGIHALLQTDEDGSRAATIRLTRAAAPEPR